MLGMATEKSTAASGPVTTPCTVARVAKGPVALVSTAIPAGVWRSTPFAVAGPETPEAKGLTSATEASKVSCMSGPVASPSTTARAPEGPLAVVSMKKPCSV